MLRRRALSTATAAVSTPRVAPQPARSVLEVSGPDAQKFLKGQMCKDVDSLGGGYSGFLNASGRILHTVFCVPNKPNSYLISHDSGAGHPSPLNTLLPPFRLRSKVRFKDVSDEWDVWAAWGAPDAMPPPEYSWRFGNGGAAERVWSWPDNERAPLGLNDTEVGCWDLRAGWGGDSMGKQIFVPKGSKPSLMSTHDLGTTDEYNLRRMLLGVPEGSDEVIPGQALPLESDMDIQGGVDFRKGCYLGQELTVRTYHTGATRKRILPVWLYDADASASELRELGEQPISPLLAPARSIPGLEGGAHLADITYTPPASAASKKARSAGKLLSLSRAASGLGLALIRLEWADRASWVAQSERGSLSVELGGKKYGLVVGQGEAYAAALADTPPPPQQSDEEAMARA